MTIRKAPVRSAPTFLSPMRKKLGPTNRTRSVSFDMMSVGDTSTLTLTYKSLDEAKANRKLLLSPKNVHAVPTEALFAAIVGAILAGHKEPS